MVFVSPTSPSCMCQVLQIVQPPGPPTRYRASLSDLLYLAYLARRVLYNSFPQTVAPPVEKLSEDTKAALVRQVEFYFSDENLPTDAFMKKKVKAGGAQGKTDLHGCLSRYASGRLALVLVTFLYGGISATEACGKRSYGRIVFDTLWQDGSGSAEARCFRDTDARYRVGWRHGPCTLRCGSRCNVP